MHLHDDDGAADGHWLLQLVVVLAILAFVGVEVFRLVMTGLQVDAAAGDVLEVAEDAYTASRRLEPARSAAADEAERLGVALVDVSLVAGVLEVTVQDVADTLVLHRVAGDAAFLNPAGTRSTGVDP